MGHIKKGVQHVGWVVQQLVTEIGAVIPIPIRIVHDELDGELYPLPQIQFLSLLVHGMVGEFCSETPRP
jgi:hypothetical protein